MLSTDETKRRIEAARILRDLSQVELDRLGHEDGLGKQELSRLERGELPLTRVRREVLIRILRVPEHWLTEEDTDVVVGVRPSSRDDLSDAQLRAASDLLALLPALADRARGQGQAPAPGAGDVSDRPPGEAEGAAG